MTGFFRIAWLFALLGAALPADSGSYLRADDYRIARIGYRLATANPHLCPRQAPVTGILLHHLAEYDSRDRPGLVAQGMDRGPGVLAVVPGSAGDSAGLKAGDIVLAVDGRPFPSPLAALAFPKVDSRRAAIEASESWFLDALARPAVRLTVLRAGATLDLTLTPRTGCLLRIRLANSDQQDAVANGPYVIVASGLLGLARNDDELAFVIAHEMAHVQLNHRDMLRAARVPRSGAMRGFGKAGDVVRRTEAEADQLGGRLTIAAGYDLDRGSQILARFGPVVTLFGLFQTHADPDVRIRALHALAVSETKPAP